MPGYALGIVLIIFLGGGSYLNLFPISGIISGLALMSLSPLPGLFYIIASLIGMVISVIFARIISEFVLIMFRINEHLGAIRQRGQQM